jgi:outer membrane protein assembly factor BamA
VVFSFHDREEIGPRMLARIAKRTGLKPEDLGAVCFCRGGHRADSIVEKPEAFGMAFPSLLKFRRVGLRSARKLLLLCGVLSFVSLPTGAQQAPPVGKMRLQKIEVSGLKRLSEEDVVARSGLETGQLVDVAALDAAAEQLLGTGLFTRLSYRYRTQGEAATVVFEVEEAKPESNIPVVFDNFVWFSEEELARAVKTQLPSFDGTAPETDGAVASITRALAQLLRERKIPAQVEYISSASVAGTNAKHIFSASGVRIPICAVQYPGAAALAETELISNSKPVLNADYSQEFMQGFAEGTLKPLYRQRGHLRVNFKQPRATPATETDKCKGGASVAVPVEEGAAYSWERAQWEGNAALSAAELDAAFGMKTGELADGLKIDKSLMAVAKAYGRRGYLLLRLKPDVEFADATRRVTYRVNVREGDQFRMGTLNIEGLPAADTNRLKAMWKLQAGDVYDAQYSEEFMRKALPLILRPGARPPQIDFSVKPDRQKLTADVTINFK